MQTTNKQGTGLNLPTREDKINIARKEALRIFERYGLEFNTPLVDLVEILTAEDFEELEFYNSIIKTQ